MTMRSSTAHLPARQRQRVDADFLANEQAYIAMRDELLRSYFGQWVAIHEDRVVAVGDSLASVTDAAAASGGHPYVARVGKEDSVVFRVRRADFDYDSNYQPFPLPRVAAIFWNHAESSSLDCRDVIPDTGADSSLLPERDCEAFNLFSSPYLVGLVSGVIGPTVSTLIYRGKVDVAGVRVAAFVQAVEDGHERIMGRDVLNEYRVLFDGPARRVSIER